MSEHSTPQHDAPEYVGFWLRFIAFLIDSVAAMFVLAVVGTILLGPSPEIDLENLGDALSRASIESVLTAILFVAFWVYFASTPGKMIFDAYIVDEKTLGRASVGKLVARYLCYYLSILVFGLGFIWIAIDGRKQGWHDKIAGTLVIKGKPDADA